MLAAQEIVELFCEIVTVRLPIIEAHRRMAYFPEFIVMKPVTKETYACYKSRIESGHVYCKGESVFNPFAEIALEQAKCNAKYYHLRFSHSYRYWAKSEDNTWIIALSKQREEDTNKPWCTLFSPTVANNGDFRLNHVQSRLHVMMEDESKGLRVDDDDGVVFSYKDWDSLVMIPKRVVIKGYNGMYLKVVLDEEDDDRQWLKFESDDGNDESSLQEVNGYGGVQWKRLGEMPSSIPEETKQRKEIVI